MKKIRTIKIRSPFKVAGNVYRWTQDGHIIIGIGIKESILKSNTIIHVECLNKKYYLSCDQALGFANRYNAFYDAGIMKDVRLAVISLSLFKQIGVKKKVSQQNFGWE